MPTVHQEHAGEVLAAFAAADLSPDTIRQALDAHVPGWRASALPLKGYGDPDHHWRVDIAIALKDVLPVPFNAAVFDWSVEHGFGPFLVFAEQPGRATEEITAVVDAAIERNAVLMNG